METQKSPFPHNRYAFATPLSSSSPSLFLLTISHTINMAGASLAESPEETVGLLKEPLVNSQKGPQVSTPPKKKAIVEMVSSGIEPPPPPRVAQNAPNGGTENAPPQRRSILRYLAAGLVGGVLALGGAVTFVWLQFGPIPAAVVAATTIVVFYVAWRVPSDPSRLAKAEVKLLDTLSESISYKQLRTKVGEKRFIGATAFHLTEDRPESGVLVMLHGLGCGGGVFIKNVEGLCKHYRTVYCVDLLGFGASSSPTFKGKTVECAVDWWVSSLHAWRQEVIGVDQKINLLGHSLGGFVATHYALAHPNTVSRLVLAAPAGVVPLKWIPTMSDRMRKVLKTVHFLKITRTKVVRSMGPSAKRAVKYVLRQRAAWYGMDSPELVDYMTHLQCAKISGEDAFLATVCPKVGWKDPLITKMSALEVGHLSVILGQRDFIGEIGEEIRTSVSVPLRVTTFEGVGHHMHTTVPDLFNEYVVKEE